MDIQSLYQKACRNISQRDARLLLKKFLNLSDLDWVLNQDRDLTHKELAYCKHLITRREMGEPVSKILGETEFYGLPFYVTSETLDPRPDTELIIDVARKLYRRTQPKSILDLGTGSGCILITLLKLFPDSFGVGADISHEALKTARRNALLNNTLARASFANSNWFEAISGSFDLIVSNPPYIQSHKIESLMTEVKDFDPVFALDGGKDGLQAYRLILDSLKKYLKQDGFALFEMGFDQCEKIKELAVKSEMCILNVHPDLNKKNRVIVICHGDK